MNIKSIISNKLRWRASFSKFSSPQNQRNNKYWGMAAFMHSDPELISDKECYCLWTLMIQWTLVYALNQLRRYSESLRAGRSGDRIPVGARFFRTRQDRTWGPPSLLHNGYQVIPRGKAAGAWSWLLTPSSAEVNERVELYLYSSSGHSWPVLGWALPPSKKVCTLHQIGNDRFHRLSKSSSTTSSLYINRLSYW